MTLADDGGVVAGVACERAVVRFAQLVQARERAEVTDFPQAGDGGLPDREHFIGIGRYLNEVLHRTVVGNISDKL